MTTTYAIPRNNSLGAYFVKASVKSVRFDRKENVEHKDLVTVSTDMQFNTLQDKIEIEIGNPFYHLPRVKLLDILKSFGAFAVKEDFDGYNIDHLNEIKEHLSNEWIKKYNYTHEMKLELAS